MLNENESNSARSKKGPVLILGLIFIALFSVAMCALSVMFQREPKGSSPIPQENIPVIIPAQSLSAEMPADRFLLRLPIILSGSVSVPDIISEQIWIVTRIKILGYELDGQRYDLATFTLINGQATSKGYCINRGWDIPDIGTEYQLTANGTFVPLRQSNDRPLQSFLKIQ